MRKTVAISLADHDASICILNDYKIDTFIQEERLNRKKHSSCLDDKLLKLLPNKIDDLILVNFYDQLKVDKVLKYTKANNVILDDINHHLYHAASAFYLSNFTVDLSILKRNCESFRFKVLLCSGPNFLDRSPVLAVSFLVSWLVLESVSDVLRSSSD